MGGVWVERCREDKVQKRSVWPRSVIAVERSETDSTGILGLVRPIKGRLRVVKCHVIGRRYAPPCGHSVLVSQGPRRALPRPGGGPSTRPRFRDTCCRDFLTEMP